MADRNASDSRHVISLAAQPPPPPTSIDNQGPDSSIPLLPQWLLSKMGDHKHETGNEDEHSGPILKNDNHLDILKSSKSSEVVDPPKKKDVFRPSLLDQETGRHERWRDEERDTNPSVRKDLWTGGDKDPAENRKTDRWTDKSASKPSGENQRAASDRWDSGNKDSGYERRDSKWTNRWGPTDKDKELLPEKPREFVRVSDNMYDKGLPTQSSQRKDGKEGDVYRPWRSNSSSQGRGRGEYPNSQTLTPSKNSAFSYGRGRSENQPPAFGHTHGRPNMSTSLSSGLVSDKEGSVHLESSLLKYSRAKLLDVFRTFDKLTTWKILDDFIDVPSLTLEELADPLGLSVPSPEEAVILMGIDKGEILSSDVPVNNTEKPADRHPSEFSQSRRPKIGSRDDLPHMIDGSLNDGFDEGDMRDKQARHSSARRVYHNSMPTLEGGTLHKSGEISASGDLGVKRDTYVPPGSSWRNLPVAEHAHSPYSERDVSDNRQSSNHGLFQSQHLKNLDNNQENGSTYKSYHQNEPKWQAGGRFVTDNQSLASLHQGSETRKLPSPLPEDLILIYKDPQGNIQGPFSGSDIIGWYEAGYFGIDLQVRSASASDDQPFSLLGDVMPHLRSKARPPPGFNAPKQSEPLDVTSKLSHSNSGKLLGNSSEMDLLKNDLRAVHGFSTDPDNRFLESLMSAPQGLFGNNSSNVSPSGVDNANLYLLAKKMALEHQQRTWTVRDPTPMISKSEIGSESASLHPALQSPLISNNHLTPPSQNSELLAMLQSVSERSSGFNNATSNWSNFPVRGGSTMDNMDLYHGQKIHQSPPLGIQHQILQSQSNPLLSLLSQSNQSATLKPDSVPAMPQDPQTRNMLQQQYLINLHSQAPAPLPQLSMLDQLLLLQQQQKHSEQQQLQLIRQQNMLSQSFSESLPHQHPGGPSYGQMQPNAIPGGGIDLLQHHMAQIQLNAGMNRPLNVQDDNRPELHKVHPQILQDVSILNSLPPQGISMQSTRIPQEVIQSHLHTSQDVMKLDPRDSGEISKSPKASEQFSHEVSKDAIRLETDSREDRTELQRRRVSIMDEVSDDFKSLDNNDPPIMMLSKTSSDTTFTLPSESTKLSSAPPKSVEFHDMSKVGRPSIENHTDGSKGRMLDNDQIIVEPALEKTVKISETLEVKKGSEKKSRRQRASKASEQGKRVLTTTLPLNKQYETNGTAVNVSEGDLLASGDNMPNLLQKSELDKQSDSIAQQKVSGYPNILNEVDVTVGKMAAEGFPSQNAQPQRAWKPAPGFKPKSLLEIQQEEQRKARAEVQTAPIALTTNSTSLSTPWAGVVANADTKTSQGTYTDAVSIESVSERALKPNSSKSELNDLLADQAKAKLNDLEKKLDNQKVTLPEPLAFDNSEPTDDFDFIQPKDTKKSRKKSGKTKGASSKTSSFTPDVSLASSPTEKIKSSRQVRQETEILPAVPSGPSLGDFVVWKGESASISSSYAPAWSNDSGKVQPVLLRDILKEQEKKASSNPTLQKPQSSQPAHGIVPSRAPAAPSLSKARVPTQVNSISTQSKHSGDDDLFWGPVDSSKQEAKQSDFPQLGTHSSPVFKSSTSLKGNIGGLTKQKSVASKTADYSQSHSPQTNLKGKKDTKSLESEAIDFRDWCQAESVRLIGTKDTSFLEFCLKQTRSEAEILLVENLGSYDPKHEFIDKFLNYKELLPSDVLEMAFQSQNDHKSSSGQASFNKSPVVESTPEPSIKSASKKKSKKGKKVSPSVLGFNVVSNRIMMGEIQTVED